MESARNTERAPAGPRVPSKHQVESLSSISASRGEEVPLSEFNEAVSVHATDVRQYFVVLVALICAPHLAPTRSSDPTPQPLPLIHFFLKKCANPSNTTA